MTWVLRLGFGNLEGGGGFGWVDFLENIFFNFVIAKIFFLIS